jgi:hypothetical protein
MSGKTVTTECELCKKSFERSVFNPYMKTCPACRKPATVAVRMAKVNSRGNAILATALLNMADKGLQGNLANTDHYTYKQKNGELYFRVGTVKYFSRKAFIEAHGL